MKTIMVKELVRRPERLISADWDFYNQESFLPNTRALWAHHSSADRRATRMMVGGVVVHRF
jgi:hypothetical protein